VENLADKRDYYETLGISKDATDTDIKKAYRKLAKKYHPDMNPGDESAEHKFKEATEAYEVLSDSSKRSKYDQFGHAAFGNGAGGAGGFSGGFDFSDVGDMFGDIFGDFFGGGGSRRRNANAPTRGASVKTSVTLDFKEAVFGVEKEIDVTISENCEECSGTGAKKGTSAETCPQCNGSGQVRYNQQTMFGNITSVKTCNRCNGAGKIIKEKCASCHGSGYVRKKKKIVVDIPAGIDNGQSIRLKGKGEPGTNGGPRGDLLVTVYIKQHEFFEREGNNIYYTLPISFAQAALGAELEVPTIDGKVKYEIKEGTQTHTRFRLRGKGVPHLRNPKVRGDQYITVVVDVPKKLNEKQKELLKEFSNTFGDSVKEGKKKKWYDKVIDAFE
jgi:molecular chaperone DnaJ